MIQLSPVRSTRLLTLRAMSLLLLLSLSTVSSGCSWIGPGNQLRQAQMESERLLSEFRAQKKRADELELKNSQIAAQLAESEKLLANLQPSSSTRLSSNAGSASRDAGVTLRSPPRNISSNPASGAIELPQSVARDSSDRSTTGRTVSNRSEPDKALQWRPKSAPIP